MTISVGDRVQVKPEYDDTLRVLAVRTRPGTVSAIYEDDIIVVDLDSGQGVPYHSHELNILNPEMLSDGT